MSIYIGDKEIKDLCIGDSSAKEVYLGDTKVRPSTGTRTFTISWTEKSNMSSGWTYSDDATGLTAGSTDFDQFFGYSAVRLASDGTETAEVKQSTPGTLDITQLGTLTSGDNVMIKFPVMGIKMSKSGNKITLSITKELNKSGYQYYAHSRGTLSNPGTPKNAFYLGAYQGYNNSNVLKSWSGKTPTSNKTQLNFINYARANDGNSGNSGYDICGFYQRAFINALYIMKYGNPNSQSLIGNGYSSGSSAQTTGATNSINTATGATNTASSGRIKLFGLEDWRGNLACWLGGMCTNGSKNLYTALSGFTGEVTTSSPYENTGTVIKNNTNVYNISSIAGNNKAMFGPIATVNNGSYNTYWCDSGSIDSSCIGVTGGCYYWGSQNGAFLIFVYYYASDTSGQVGARLMYL